MNQLNGNFTQEILRDKKSSSMSSQQGQKQKQGQPHLQKTSTIAKTNGHGNECENSQKNHQSCRLLLGDIDFILFATNGNEAPYFLI